MGKFIVWLFILLAGFFLFLWFMKTPIMSSYLSKKLKVDISMGGVSISSTGMGIDKFSMNNPKGYQQEKAFTSEKIQADFSFSQLFGTPATIDRITLDNVFLGVVCRSPNCSSNNWTEIVAGIKQAEGKITHKEYLIKKIVMRNLHVQILGLSPALGGNKSVTIPLIEFDNVSSKTGFPTEQLIAAIFQRAGLMDFLKDILVPQQMIKDVMNPFKIFGQNQAETEGSISQVKE
jgi:hypothetical protein